ncbi:hypothetical protein KJ695_03075 [Patescibacteria group bacterium]|nr:hypothetical protein [Patescibacteria group bacterium]
MIKFKNRLVYLIFNATVVIPAELYNSTRIKLSRCFDQNLKTAIIKLLINSDKQF